MWWKTLILFSQMSNSRVKKLYCMCFKTTRQWSKWLWKTEVLQWDTSPKPTDLFLIDCSIELIWISKSKSNTSTTKKQHANILTIRNFTRDEWNYLLCLFNICHFSLINWFEVMYSETYDEFEFKGSLNSVIFGIRKLGEEKLWKLKPSRVRKLVNVLEWGHPLEIWWIKEGNWNRTTQNDDESYCQDAVVRVVLSFSEPGERKLRKSRSMKFYCWGEIGATWYHHYHEQIKIFCSTNSAKWDNNNVRLLGATWQNFWEVRKVLTWLLSRNFFLWRNAINPFVNRVNAQVQKR